MTETCSYDANWAQNYVPDEIYYSANSITYLPNSVAPAPGTEYMIFSGLGGGFQDAYALINGQSYSPNLIMTGSPFSAIAGLSGTTATIGAAADTTVYPGSTYYPVTFSPGLSTLSSVGSAEAGQTYEVATISGTYKTASATSNPVDSTTIPLFTSISGSFVKTSYSSVTGAVASTNNSSVTYTPATDPLASFAMSLGKATNSSRRGRERHHPDRHRRYARLQQQHGQICPEVEGEARHGLVRRIQGIARHGAEQQHDLGGPLPGVGPPAARDSRFRPRG